MSIVVFELPQLAETMRPTAKMTPTKGENDQNDAEVCGISMDHKVTLARGSLEVRPPTVKR